MKKKMPTFSKRKGKKVISVIKSGNIDIINAVSKTSKIKLLTEIDKENI